MDTKKGLLGKFMKGMIVLMWACCIYLILTFTVELCSDREWTLKQLRIAVILLDVFWGFFVAAVSFTIIYSNDEAWEEGFNIGKLMPWRKN